MGVTTGPCSGRRTDRRPTSDRRGSRLDGGLARALLLDKLRMARWLAADAGLLTNEDRARIARDLRAIARRTGVPLVRSRS